MHQGDFEGFATLLRRIASVYSKKLTDDVIQGYWIALKDQSLVTITELANTHTRYGKFFPKPIELRPKDDKPEPTSDGKFEEGEERALRNLEELRQKRPEEWAARLTESHGDGCRALMYAREFGVENIWFDVPNRCWRNLVGNKAGSVQ